jgi:O-antigen ligase
MTPLNSAFQFQKLENSTTPKNKSLMFHKFKNLLLPVCLSMTLLAIALQGVAFYILLGVLFSLTCHASWKVKILFLKLSACLFSFYIIFVFSNFLSLLYPTSLWNEYLQNQSSLINFYKLQNSTQALNLKYSIFKENRVSSAFLACSVVFLSLIFFKSKIQDTSLKTQKNFSINLKTVVYIFSVFSVFLLCQFIFGLDLKRGFQSFLPPEYRQLGGFYRVLGFYGHPLSLASVGLALGTCCYWKMTDRLFLNWKASQQWLFLGVLGVFITALTGGRTSLAICIFLVFSAFILHFYSFLKYKKQASVKILALVLLPFLFLKQLGQILLWLKKTFLGRFQFPSENVLSSQPDRFKFWEIHWKLFLDSPWFGQGSGALENGLRTFAYHKYGHERLKDKFNAHNIFLESLATVGLLGSMVLLVASLFSLFYLTKIIQHNNQKETKNYFWKTFAFLSISFMVNLVHGFTQNTYFDSNVSYFYLNCMLIYLIYNFSKE